VDGQIAILQQSRGPWEFQRHPLPDPEPGAILVRISHANVCGSDLHIWRSESAIPWGHRAMGHEMAGRVFALGAGAVTP
jgi:D-arabinose 1-dehydrogenase-like Zn-dependent alcohol dehydrogenase